MNRRRWPVLAGSFAALLLSLAACVAARVELPAAPVAAGPAIAVQTTTVSLDPADAARTAVGAFTFAGGIAVTSDQSSRLHGLSDMIIEGGDRLTAVSDDGDLFTGRLVLDGKGRLVGLTEGALRPLTGLTGQPVQGKDWGDAEGLARLGNGDLLVSFERQHRIWRYTANGRARPVRQPLARMANNDGMEGLAAAATLSADGYWVGIEPGDIWYCALKVTCIPQDGLPKPGPGWRLSGLTTGPNGELVILHHSWSPVLGSRIEVLVVKSPAGTKTVIGQFKLAPPLTTDNFEGLAIVPLSDSIWRIYLLSDDNFSPTQRTLLLAFDWTPPK
ncbi:MAG: esterase-like activity of phytase family protein [Caulobacter sp.]|nr:esterase-like activity of phytase family protein [Caulobacter sp.]